MNERAEWFLQSPIASEDGRYVSFYPGGPVYGEITAYAISLACIWYRRARDRRYLERARRSAEYLLEVSRPGVRGPTDQRIYVFDTGILASGLLDLFATTRDASYLAEAKRRLDWLLAQFDGASLPATVPEATAPGRGRGGGRRGWPLRRSIHLGKVALPFLKGWRATQREEYRDAARRLFAWALPFQTPDGRFRISEADGATMTHAHCYVTEAMLYGAWGGGGTLQDAGLREATERAANWLAQVQNADGSFYMWYGRRGPLRTKVSDATAQALRIWRIMGLHQDGAKRAEAYLQSVATQDGGLPNHVIQLGPFHWRQRRVYSWPTFFWHHALGISFGDGAAAQEMF